MTKCLSEKRLKSPWITSAIVKCIRKKFRWYRLMKQNLILRASYREYAAELRKLLRVAEQEYYVRRFNSLDKDMKRNWKILNTLLGKNSVKTTDSFLINNNQVSDFKTICTEFGRYFIEHPEPVHSSIPSSSSNFIKNIPMNSSTIFINYANETEI